MSGCWQSNYSAPQPLFSRADAITAMPACRPWQETPEFNQNPLSAFERMWSMSHAICTAWRICVGASTSSVYSSILVSNESWLICISTIASFCCILPSGGCSSVNFVLSRMSQLYMKFCRKQPVLLDHCTLPIFHKLQNTCTYMYILLTHGMVITFSWINLDLSRCTTVRMCHCCD